MSSDVERPVGPRSGARPRSKPRSLFISKYGGHAQPVECVALRHEDSDIFASAGADRSIRIWSIDKRKRVALIEEAHFHEINCIAWDPFNPLRFTSGSAKGGLKTYDMRRLDAPVWSETLADDVMRVRYSPSVPDVFASIDTERMNLWSSSEASPPESSSSSSAASSAASGEDNVREPKYSVFLRHAGHRSEVQDVRWHPTNAYEAVTVADESLQKLGGGTFQAWRVHPYVWGNEDVGLEEELAELEKRVEAKKRDEEDEDGDEDEARKKQRV